MLGTRTLKNSRAAVAPDIKPDSIASGETGVLIDSNDQQTLLAELVALHENNDWREMLGHNAQASYQSLFRRKTMTDAYSSLYQLLWSGK